MYKGVFFILRKDTEIRFLLLYFGITKICTYRKFMIFSEMWSKYRVSLRSVEFDV